MGAAGQNHQKSGESIGGSVVAELRMFTMKEVVAEPVSWLWEPYIPHGKITIVQGDPGSGKTTLTLAVAAGRRRERRSLTGWVR